MFGGKAIHVNLVGIPPPIKEALYNYGSLLFCSVAPPIPNFKGLLVGAAATQQDRDFQPGHNSIKQRGSGGEKVCGAVIFVNLMLVAPTQFLLYILDPQSECEHWVLVCIQLSFHSQVFTAVLWCTASGEAQLAFSLIPAPGDPGAACCPAEKGPWLCGSLIATLCPPPGEPCSEMGDLHFRNLSAWGEGLCFKVLSVFKGVVFHTDICSLRFRRQTTAEDKLKDLGSVQVKLSARRKPRQGFHVRVLFMLHISHFITPNSSPSA